MADPINTHGYIMPIGRHAGQPITRVPVSYLTWMVGARHSLADVARAELQRRGTTLPTLDISHHAIDRASLHCRKIWHETCLEDEGIASWLHRIAAEALKREPDDKGRHVYAGMKFVFEMDGEWPVLKTVVKARRTTESTPEEQ